MLKNDLRSLLTEFKTEVRSAKVNGALAGNPRKLIASKKSRLSTEAEKLKQSVLWILEESDNHSYN